MTVWVQYSRMAAGSGVSRSIKVAANIEAGVALKADLLYGVIIMCDPPGNARISGVFSGMGQSPAAQRICLLR